MTQQAPEAGPAPEQNRVPAPLDAVPGWGEVTTGCTAPTGACSYPSCRCHLSLADSRTPRLRQEDQLPDFVPAK